jgi:hypothetical protein
MAKSETLSMFSLISVFDARIDTHMPTRDETRGRRVRSGADALGDSRSPEDEPQADAQGGTQEPSPALVAAMTTEHFVMQNVHSTATSEAAARASIYMYSLSGSLVALGLCAQSRPALMPFIASVFPAIVLLGVFTVVGLVDISIDHLEARERIVRIHAWYATLGSAAAEQFRTRPGQGIESGIPALRFGPIVGGLTTIASMVATINSIVFGAAVSLAALHVMHAPLMSGIAAGAIAAGGLVAGFYAYQSFRLHEAVTDAADAQARTLLAGFE